MQKYKAGDIFTFQITDEEYIAGRVMLDLKQQVTRQPSLKPAPALASFEGATLVEIYRETSPEPSARPSDVLIPGVFVQSVALSRGAWTVVDHVAINPELVDFPENLTLYGFTVRFQRGEISLPINLSERERERLDASPTIYGTEGIRQICLHLLGRSSEPSTLSDLRFSSERSDIYQRLVLEESASYFDISTLLGYNIRRFYKKTGRKSSGRSRDQGEGIVILCPYCMSPIHEDDNPCPRCNLEIEDALIEEEPDHYREAERKTCPFCGAFIHVLADPCPSCRKPQG